MNHYICQYEQHFGQKIQGYCINSECKSKPQFCKQCINDYHKDHQQDCKDRNALILLIQQLINQKSEMMNKIQNTKQKIEKLMQSNLDYTYSEIQKLRQLENYCSTEAYCDFKENIIILKQYIKNSQQMKDWEFICELERDEQTIKIATENRQLEDNKMKARYYYENGQTLSNQQNYQSAIDNFTQAIQLDATNDEYYIALSNQLINLKQYEKAIEQCNNAIKIKPESFVAHCNCGFALNRIKLCEKARQVIEKAIQINPNEVQAQIIKGEILFDAQSYKEALECFEKVIQINPLAYQAYNYQALALHKLKNYKQALAICEQALQYQENNLDMYILITYVLNQLKEFQRAIQYCDVAIRKQMKSETLYNNQGYALLNIQQNEKAIENFDKALEMNPNFEFAFSNKGDALVGLRLYQQAMTVYEQAFKISDNQKHYVKKLELELLILKGQQQQQLQMRSTSQISNTIITIQNLSYGLAVQLDKSAHIQVYKGYDVETNQKVLIKIIETKESKQVEKYELMASKKFQNIINIISLELKSGKLYIAMEFSQNYLLNDYKGECKQRQQNARYIIKQIANGLMELHRLGLNHMNIKPSNIIIETLTDQCNNEQNIYKLCDYGEMIQENQLFEFYNESYYQAPEQLDKNATLVHPNKVDIWGFGIVCLELYSFQNLFQGEKKIKEINQEDIIQLINGTNCDPKFQHLFEQMLQIDPEKRYDIKQVLNELKIESQIKNRQLSISSINTSPFRNQQHLQHQYSYPNFKNQIIQLKRGDQFSKQDSNIKSLGYVSNFNYYFSQEQILELNNG